MRTKQHFTILIYPFHHLIEGNKKGPSRLSQLPTHWVHWWNRLTDNQLLDTLDDTYFFLPYVRKLLFPETNWLSGDATIQAESARNQFRVLSRKAINEIILKDGLIRLTYNPAILKTLQSLELRFTLGSTSFSASVKIDWIDVFLFPQRVGFLALKMRIADHKPPDTARINDFLYYARQVLPFQRGYKVATWRCIGTELTEEFSSQELIDYLLQGFTQESPLNAESFGSFLQAVKTGNTQRRYSLSETGQVYGMSFRHFTFVCLGENQEDFTYDSNDSLESPDSKTPPLFASLSEQTLYELATCTDTRDPNYKPHPTGLSQLMEKAYIAIWDNWQGLALHDSVIFLAIRPTSFTEKVLPKNVETDYFHLYLLTLYQKVRLSLLAGDIMRERGYLHRNLRAAKSRQDEFMQFRNHYWFEQVTFKPQGIELYRRFQLGLEILLLYEAVSSELKDLSEHYERKMEMRTGKLINFLTCVGLPLGILSNLFSDTIQKELNQVPLSFLLGASGVLLVLSILVFYFWNRTLKT
ncbi:MAG: hypothetical protein AB1374_12565 [Bacillota bacterium]